MKRFFDKKWKVVVAVILGLGLIGSITGIGEEPKEEAKTEVEEPVKEADEQEEEIKALFDVRELAGKTQEEMDSIVGVNSTVNADGNYLYGLEEYELEVSEVDFENWFTITPKAEKSVKDDWEEIFKTFGLPTNKPGQENTIMGGKNWNDYQTVDGTDGVDLFSNGSVEESSDEVSFMLVKVSK